MATLAEPAPSAGGIRYRPRRLGHVNLFVTDFRRSMDFYKAVCGFHESARETSSGSGFLSNGSTHHDVGLSDITLFTRYIMGRGLKRLPNHMDRPGLYHFGWEMATEADLVAAYQRALALGETPRVTDAGTGRSNYMVDPDGYSHQFYVDKVRDWRTVYVGGETVLHGNPPWDPLAGPPSIDHHYDDDPVILRHAHAPIHPVRVTHGAMQTARFDEALEFYQSIGGFDLVHARFDGRCAYLRGSASRYDVVLLQAADGEPAGLHHAAFEVGADEDLDAAAAQLGRMGIPLVADLSLRHKRALVIGDPDELLVEFYQPRAADFADVDDASPKELALIA